MGDPKAFLNIPRQEAGYRPVNERIADYSQVEQTLNTNSRKLQASRCMDCGVPFCHWACPIGNKQPEWQDALYRGKWKEAYEVLSSTCDFPEFTSLLPFLLFQQIRRGSAKYFPRTGPRGKPRVIYREIERVNPVNISIESRLMGTK